MRTRLPHLFDNWLPFMGAGALFTDAFGRTLVPGWGTVSDWAGWLVLAAFAFCQYKFGVWHVTADCAQCPHADPQGHAAARRSRWMLRAVHALAPLGLLVHRLGGGPVAIGAVLIIVLGVAPILLIGWFAPDGFTVAFLFTYLAVAHTCFGRHADLAPWCPWCHHGGGGGGGGGHDHPEPDPDPVPTSQRDLTLAA